ncbi:hypothetical protein [Mucilaginibacter antarcticus]|uniref:hypothetical protein n=1 Tax=Mucilaginibacter antarcticus TaxID=1855725 RepID=UPI0036399CED
MNKKNILIAATAVIITLLILVFATDLSNYISYYTSDMERFDAGDKLNLKEEFLSKDYSISTYRTVRPLTMDEYEITHYMFTKEEADEKYKKIVFHDDFFLVNSFRILTG